MSALSQTFTVGTSAVKLFGGTGQGGQQVAVVNLHATNIVYIGGSGVTTANGFRIPSGAATNAAFGPITLQAGEELWAISSAAGSDVRVLSTSS
jgi:hypothetical protein